MTFKISSTSMADGKVLDSKQVFNNWGAMGGNLSPQVSWQGAPDGTQSYAITMFDPDAPTGSGWWHWTVVNIPASVNEIAEGGPLPQGAVQGRNDYGGAAYGGACPPIGDKAHRYELTVWALKAPVLEGIGEMTPGAQVGYNLNAHMLAKATITGKYAR